MRVLTVTGVQTCALPISSEGAIAIDQGSRSTQHFDAVYGPGVEGKTHAHTAILASAVIQTHDRRGVGEAPCRQRTAAVARMPQAGDKIGRASCRERV